MHPQTIAVLTYQSIALGLLCYWPYIRDIRRGTTRPERFSWFIWLCNDLIALITQLVKLQTDPQASWVGCGLTAAHVVGIVVVFALSLKYGVTDRSIAAVHRNWRMIACIAAGLALWRLTEEPAVGLAVVIGIDFCAAWVTARKAYVDPGSETKSTWAGYGISGICSLAAALGGLTFEENASLLSMAEASFMALAYPMYIVISCLGMYYLIIWRLKVTGQAGEASAVISVAATMTADPAAQAAVSASGNTKPFQSIPTEEPVECGQGDGHSSSEGRVLIAA